MRTTITLDPDVAMKVRERVEQSHLTLKEVINETLRAGLKVSAPKPRRRFVVKPLNLEFRPGIDPNRLNQLLDEMEVEELFAKQARDPS